MSLSNIKEGVSGMRLNFFENLNKVKGGYKEHTYKMQEKKSSYDIICPYDFRRFAPNEVLFRSENEEEELTQDIELENYWRLVSGGSIEPGLQKKIIRPETVNQVNHKYQNGILVGLEEKNGCITHTRVCPYCHNRLPHTAGKSPSNIISFYGSTNVGKTVYMTILINMLCDRTQNNFGASCIEVTAGFGKLGEFEEKLRSILESGHQATAPKYIKPLVFSFCFADKNKPDLTLCFYDFPGEKDLDAEFVALKANHLRNASALIYMIDPLQFETVAELMNKKKLSNKSLIKSNIAFMDETFAETDNFSALKKPLAVVLTKTDELKELAQKREDIISPYSNMFKDFEHKEYLDLDEVFNINNDVLEFIRHTEPTIENDVKIRFPNAGFFGVSALGSPTINNKVQNEIQPCRVDEPFLWILYQLGYIKGREKNV